MNEASHKTAAQLVYEAKQQIGNLTPEEVMEEVGRGSLVVDLREPEERRQSGYIEGSVPAARGMLEFWADPSSPYHRQEFQPSSRVVLYCASGGRSALGGVCLQQLGYTEVAHLEGGFKAWKDAGLPVNGVEE